MFIVARRAATEGLLLCLSEAKILPIIQQCWVQGEEESWDAKLYSCTTAANLCLNQQQYVTTISIDGDEVIITTEVHTKAIIKKCC